MNPSTSFCPHSDCVMRGLQDQGTVIIHSRQEQRYQCTCCGHTFAATSGTPYYRLRSPRQRVDWVVSRLAHGCPLQAIVVTFGLDERTVAAWQQRAGEPGQQVHAATVQQGQLDLQHVQADELWGKAVGRCFRMALALDAVSRLWLGGAVQTTRDGALIENVVQQVRRCARSLGLLVCVDGLSSYVTAFRRALREPCRTGGVGRPRLPPAPGFLLGQVIKRCAQRRLVEVIHRPVVGTLAEIETRLRETGSGQGIHTAYIERLNATFRSGCPLGAAALTRRGRRLARKGTTLQAGMALVGSVYNFCTVHDSLRLPVAASGSLPRRWQARTPAMAAGWTDHRWSVGELLAYRVPPPPWEWPKRRGRKPKQPRGIPWKLRPHRVLLPPTTV